MSDLRVEARLPGRNRQGDGRVIDWLLEASFAAAQAGDAGRVLRAARGNAISVPARLDLVAEGDLVPGTDQAECIQLHSPEVRIWSRGGV